MRLRSLVYFMVCFACVSNARADLIRHGDSLLDTTTNLLWSVVQLPTTTFVLDSTTLTVATTGQYFELFSHIDAPAIGPYSAQTHALAQWLTNSAVWTYAGYADQGLGECTGPNNGGNCFVGAVIDYRPVDFSPQENWALGFFQTISTYGPDFALNANEWSTEYVSAWAVQAVPLPGAVVLLAGGLAFFGLVRRKRALAR